MVQMMRWHSVVLIALLMASMPVEAQEPPEPSDASLYHFTLEGPTEIEPIAVGELRTIELEFTDHSLDDSGAFGGPASGQLPHRTVLSAEVVSGHAEGWTISPMPDFKTFAGDSQTGRFIVQPRTTVDEPYLELRITAIMTDQQTGTQVNGSLSLTFFTPGQQVFSAQPRGSTDLSPGQAATVSVAINHLGLLPRTFDAELLENPCDLKIVPFPTVTIQEKGTQVLTFDVQGPEEKFWYFFEDCSMALGVYAVDDSDRVVRVTLSTTVNGGYVDPVWIFWALAAITAVVLIVFFVLRRKAIIEEELLGKPQKPWTIPVERVYLEHLEQKDPRAAYVVRHFLMEEEYQSALLWYKGYKKATKGTRSKESLVVSQEKSYERFRKKWTKKIARPIKKADRLEARLQKKLDRRAKGDVRGQRRKWKKAVAKIESAHAAKQERAMRKWEKAAAKAEKKGEAVPAKPDMSGPELPPEPTMGKVLLADHRWNKKAMRFRKRMVKKQGNLEVKFEKKDARRLAKVQRKVQKIARKIDDPEFASEHPLLQAPSDDA